MTLRILVVGCGSIGERHLSNLLDTTSVEVLACDVDQKTVERISEEYEVEATTDLEQALRKEPDCVFVCTPPSSHLEIAHEALEIGSDVFIEKPLSDTLDETERIVKKQQETDQLVFVACNMRFHPPVVKIQEYLDAGRIGDLQFVRLRYGNDLRNWRSTDYQESYSGDSKEGGGIILDGVHELDIALQWMDKIDDVSATVGRVSNLEIDVEDVTEIILNSESMMTEVHLDYIRPERARTYELIGSDGMIRWMGRGKNPEESTVELHSRADGLTEETEYTCTLNEQYIEEIEHVLACLRGEETPEMDARRGKEVLELAYAAKQAEHATSENTIEEPSR